MQDELQREKQKEDSLRSDMPSAGPAAVHNAVVSDDATFFVGSIERLEAEVCVCVCVCLFVCRFIMSFAAHVGWASGWHIPCPFE